MKTSSVQLRVFVACPNDLVAERNSVAHSIEDLSPIAESLNLELKILDWRKIVPDLGRPQKIIFDQLKPTEWDLFVGILWHRFGTPPGKGGSKSKAPASGTEEEFQTAHKLWKKFGRPRVMFYRCLRPIPPEQLDPTQYLQVQDFFAQFEAVGKTPGLFHKFTTVGQLGKLLRRHIGKFLVEHSKVTGVSVPPTMALEFETDIVDNLPRRSSFFGRHKDMQTALNALSPQERGWGLVIDGIGGIGKTSLALEAAHRCRDRHEFENFVVVSAKRDHLEPGSIRKEPMTAVGLDYFLDETAKLFHREHIATFALGKKKEALREILRETRTLLIYDNLETLTNEVQDDTAAFLRTLPPGCKAIITSRRRGGEGAVWLRLDDLVWDEAKQIIENEMRLDPWLENQLKRVSESRWKELFVLTGRSPLALVWCLGRIRLRKWTFDDALKAIENGELTESDLQEFMFGENHRSLDEAQKAVLCSLAFYERSATLESLIEISYLSRTALQTTLQQLTAVSLVGEEMGTEDRFHLNQLTRGYVKRKLIGDDETRRVFGTRFFRYWLEYSRRYAVGRDSYRTFERLDVEWANIWAAHDWLWSTCFQESRVTNGALAGMLNEFAEALGAYLVCRGKWDERLVLSEHAYATESLLDNWDGAFWRAYDVAWIYIQRGSLPEAKHWIYMCQVAASRTVNPVKNKAIVDRLGGLVHWSEGNHQLATSVLDGAFERMNSLNLDDEMARVGNDLVMLHCERIELAQARTRFGIIESLLEKPINREEQCRGWLASATLARLEKQTQKARADFSKTLDISTELGRLDLKAKALIGLAHIEEESGNSRRALELAKEAFSYFVVLRHRNAASAKEYVDRLLNIQLP